MSEKYPKLFREENDKYNIHFECKSRKIAQQAMGVPFMVHPLLYNRGKEVAVMEQNNGKMCSMCGKKFDMWDEQENFCFVRHIGYGSKYDMMGLYLNLCCDCFDKIADWFLPLCVNDPLVDEQDCWRSCSSGVENELFFHKQLLERMKDGVQQLSVQLNGILADARDFKLQLKKAADALMRLFDRVQFEMKRLDARSDEEEI